MNTHFKHFYGSDDINSDNIKDEDILICLDTNVLLNIYRYSDDTRELLFEAIDTLKDKIFIPYNVAHEFSYNKKAVLNNVVRQQSNIESEVQKKSENFKKEIEEMINTSKEMRCDSSKNTIKEIKDSFSKDFDAFLSNWTRNSLSNLFNSYKDLDTNDSISDRLANSLDKKVGLPYNQEDLKSICEEGEKRYSIGMPPGYADDTGDKDKTDYYYILDENNNKFTPSIQFNKKYGDLIIWYQIIDKAKKSSNFNKVLFVTDDSKKDWIYKVSNRTIGMRAELRNEFHAKTDKYIKIINTNSFLQYFNNNKENYITYERSYYNNRTKDNINDESFEFIYQDNFNNYMHKMKIENRNKLTSDISNISKSINRFMRTVSRLALIKDFELNNVNNLEFYKVNNLISNIEKQISNVEKNIHSFSNDDSKLIYNLILEFENLKNIYEDTFLEYKQLKKACE